MATISIDFDSKADVELVLHGKDNTWLDQAGQQAPSSSEKCNVGPLGIKITQVRLRVSSLKLMSSSLYFQAMLEGPAFREGKELKEHSFVEIELSDPEDEPTAAMIVLGILYGNDVQVPVELDLPMQYKVAVLVDKYQWHALVTPHATSWFDRLSDSQGFPDAVDDTLLMQLYIAWLFGMKDHFKMLSGIAQQVSCRSIDLTDESIRLPTRALKAINEQREVAFQKIEQVFKAFKESLLEDKLQSPCPEYKYMVFGFATFYSRDLELGDFAAPDHVGTSVRSLSNRIDSFQSIEHTKIIALTRDPRCYTSGGGWDLKRMLQRAIRDLEMDGWGLDYDNFKPSQVDNQPNRVLDLG